MWDRPDLLNRAANVLFVLALLACAYGAIWHVVHQPVFALRHVDVTGEARHITRDQVEAIVKNELRGTFFTLNLPQLRRAFEKLPWVREANLRRRWPDRLEVKVVEHVPLARWGNTALVNVQGEVFQAAYDGKLPVFIGPAGTSKEIAIQYEHFKRTLSLIDTKPVLVQVTPRRAWRVKIEGGPTLELGREDIEPRLARYLDVHERTVGALKRRVDYVDLRYTNGFAVRILELKGQPWPPESAAAGAQGATGSARRPSTGAGQSGARSRPKRSEGAVRAL